MLYCSEDHLQAAALSMTSVATETPRIAAPDGSRRLLRLRPRLVPHLPAVVFIVTTLLLPVGAINGQNNLLFWMFGLAIAALLGSGIFGAWLISSIVVERDPIPSGHVGDTVRITYRITNTSRWIPAFAVTVAEFPARPRILRSQRPLPTWPDRFSQGCAFAEYIPRGGTVLAHAEVAVLRHGRAVFDTVEVWTTFPFGLSRKTIFHAREQEAVAKPALLPLRPEFQSLITAPRGGAGEGAMALPGSGGEFHSLRDLADGDPPRLVAWKRSAMTDRLLVRQSSLPQNRRMWIGIADLRGVSEDDAEDAVAAAAAIASAAAMSGCAVGLLGSPAREAFAPRGGSRALGEVLTALALLDPVADGPSTAPPSMNHQRVVVVDPLLRPVPISGASVHAPSEILLDTHLRPRSSLAARRSLAYRLGKLVSELLPSSPRAVEGTR